MSEADTKGMLGWGQSRGAAVSYPEELRQNIAKELSVLTQREIWRICANLHIPENKLTWSILKINTECNEPLLLCILCAIFEASFLNNKEFESWI